MGQRIVIANSRSSGSFWIIITAVAVLAFLGIWMLKRYQANEEARLAQPSQPTAVHQTTDTDKNK